MLQLAFYPPTPPSYDVRAHSDGSGQLFIQPLERGYPRVPNAQVSAAVSAVDRRQQPRCSAWPTAGTWCAAAAARPHRGGAMAGVELLPYFACAPYRPSPECTHWPQLHSACLLLWVPPQVEWVDVPRRREGGGGGRVVTAFLPFRDARGRPARATVLYSHGNAVDLGQVMPLYRWGAGRGRRVPQQLVWR